MRKGILKIGRDGLASHFRDAARSGWWGIRLFGGRAAGVMLTITPSVGTWAEISARDDLLLIDGARALVTDVGNAPGSYWIARGGVWYPDGPIYGTGAPAVVAPVGSLYVRTDGGAVTTLYVKESGTGTSTGWVAK